MNPPVVDLNCDVGEGVGREADLLPWVTSANVACGAHAGDPVTMAATMALARKLGVVVGAHPGFADRAHFGRRELTLSSAAIRALVRDQLRDLGEQGAFSYVKPHGALYNLAARDERVAAAVVAAVKAWSRELVVLGLAGSVLVAAARAAELRAVEEVFADRAYAADGSLVPRDQPGAVWHDAAAVVGQVLTMVRERRVRAVTGEWVPVAADSICVHGDGLHAVEFARRLRGELASAGVTLRSFAA